MVEVTTTQDAILNALKQVKDPDLGRDIVSLGFVKEVKASGENISLTIELTTPACPVREQMKEEARRAVLSLPGIQNVEIQMTSRVRATQSESASLAEGQAGKTGSAGGVNLVPQVKNIIPIASGKGGVGKSTVSANLAVALSQLGARVGLADMDVYGPSIPTLMGALDAPAQEDGKIIPIVAYGVKIISMGFFVPKDTAVIWRGPMLSKTVEQFLGAVQWGELDYLVVDLPPGTGDVQLSLCQKVPLTGAAIVSTPQDVALNVAEKAMIMFDKLRTPVLGIIENMSGFVCTHCGQREEIFGSGGVRRYCLDHDLPFLGEIPLSTDIRTSSDSGLPIVDSAPDSASAKAFLMVAKNLAAQVSIKTSGAEEQTDRPEPKEFTQPSKEVIRILWKDGHESLYPARHLRLNCSCAGCIDEMSGKKRLRDEAVPKDVYPLSTNPVGRYAYQIHWSDGHRTGIYTFEHLRGLCQCEKCKKESMQN
ncbi:P-loop NTPase [candidate division TA06 bacterium]|nr:P-loop NTPase [candidate division TA06 bacterium]